MAANTSVRAGAAAKAERRKKIFVIAGSVVLVLVLAYEIPSTLKRLHPSAPATAAAPAQTTTTAADAMKNASGVPTARQRRQLAHLKAHDPFAPLIRGTIGGGGAATPNAPSSSPPPAGGGATGSASKAPPQPKDTSTATTTTQGPIGFTAPNATPVVPVVAPAAAIIWVNGKAQTVGLKQVFPLKAPAFVLVAIDRKTMKIRVAGGSFTGGRGVITLQRGKTVTLVNTTTGVRYVIRFATALAALPATDTGSSSNGSAAPQSGSTAPKTGSTK